MTDQTTKTAAQGTITSVGARFYELLLDIEAIPGEESEELQVAKMRVQQALAHVVQHFTNVNDAAIAKVATVECRVKTDATAVETAGAPPARVARVAAPTRPVAPSNAEALVPAITPKPKRGGNRKERKFTDEQLLAAIEEHGHDNKAIAARLGVSKGWINVERRRLGGAEPEGWSALPKSAKHAVPD